MEWDDLIAAIREDKPYNETERGTEASLQAVLGRMAAHTGRVITRDELLKVDHEFAPDVDKLTLDSPVAARGRRGRQVSDSAAGKIVDREYLTALKSQRKGAKSAKKCIRTGYEQRD